jgi:hypothetical protein
MKNFSLTYLLIFCCAISFGQEQPEPISNLIESNIENINENDESEPDYESLMTDLENLKINPLNLNTVSASDLERLWFLTDFQIQSLLEYRKSMSQINSIYELNYVYGFNEKTVQQIAPFIIIGERKSIDSITARALHSHNEFLLRAAYKNNADPSYIGNSLQLYSRFKGNQNNRVIYGLLAEKDAGEEFAKESNNQGLDFYSGFLQINPNTILKSVILGDYRIHAGQGLLVWNGYGCGNPSVFSGTLKRGQGVSGNSSKDEYNFLRGTAVVTCIKNFSLTVFTSEKYIDGTLDSVDGSFGLVSINKSGYHRTNTEVIRKHNTREQITGSILNFRSEHFFAGINWLNTRYEYPFLQSEEPYKRNNFTGKFCTGISADYRFLYQKIQFYGETASSNNSTASLDGINFMLSSKFTANMFYRYYSASYYSPYSNAVGANSATANEQGIFFGFNWQTPWSMILTAYTDVFSFPWLSYNADRPLNGSESVVQMSYSPSKDIEIILRCRSSHKDKNQSLENSAGNEVNTFEKQNLRLQGWFALSDKINFTSRIEWCQSGYYSSKTTAGILVYTGFGYKIKKQSSLSFRYSFYNIDDFNSRIYAYENDILYSYSVPAFSGNGQKIYVMFKHQFCENATLWLRYEFSREFALDSESAQGIKGQLILKF